MIKRAGRFFFAFLFALLFSDAFSQIACTPTSGCAPLNGVSFSGVTGASGILWNFGDGGFASNNNNPTHTFVSPGSYTVTYNATVGGGPVTHTLNVVVNTKPSPNFSYTLPASHCAPMSVPFTDLSTNSTGAITNWVWNFGDGGVSNQQNPTYVYTIPGTYSVTLIAKANGCDSSITKNAIINVSASPTVIIKSNPTALTSCTVPFSATFSGTSCVSGSPIGSALTYSWNFANGNTSTIISPPLQSYTANGVYNVSLTVTDNNSCSKTVSTPVTLLQPSVNVVVPDTICYGYRYIFNDNSAAANTSWSWSDGTPGENNVPNDTVMHWFYQPGPMTLSITASIGACVTTKTFAIYVQKVVASFTATAPSWTCNAVLPVTYSNTSTWGSPVQPCSSFIWLFPSNSAPGSFTMGGPNPSTVITQGSTGTYSAYTIFQEYQPTITLVAISHFGCRDTVENIYDSIRRITSYFYPDKRQGCGPLTVTFNDTSFSSQPIVLYQWDFGDGSPIVSSPTATQVVHTYAAPGTYTVNHFIQNSLGCTDLSFVDTIIVSTPPVPSFTFGPSSVCWNQSVTIVNTTAATPAVQHWHVNSDLTYFSHCITDPNPSWAFNHTGTFGFTMTAYSYGCEGSTASTSSITVKGPIGRGRYYTRCDSSYKVHFTAYLQECDSARWNWGDGTSTGLGSLDSYTSTHTYAASGDYTVILTSYNGSTGCLPFKDTLIVKVRKIQAAITSPAVSCEGVSTVFSSTNTLDELVGCNIGYTWFFDSDPPVVTEIDSVYYSLAPGLHDVSLVVRDVNNCFDTSKTTINISQVTASMTIAQSTGCLPGFTFTPLNASTSNTTMTYVWNFGTTPPATSTQTNPTYVYTAVATPPTQQFTVSLYVTNAFGCIDSAKSVIQVNAPQPFVNSNLPPNICAGTSLQYSANNVGPGTYIWNWGDGSPVQTTTSNPVSHPYNIPGNFTITLNTTDANGCQGAATYPVNVQAYPQAGFTWINACNPTATVACSGCNITFVDTSVNLYPGPRRWDFYSGAPVVGTQSVSPPTPYSTPGVYAISLTVTTTFGCTDVITHTIQVYGAAADFITDKTDVCLNEVVKFTIKDTSNVFTWAWDFADGNGAGNVSPVNHMYTYHPPGNVANAVLIYWTKDSACKYSQVHPVNIRDVIADFDRNNEIAVQDTVHCQGVLDVFTNTSQNANSYNWNFGDGGTTTTTSPSHLYATPGLYTVTLAISDIQYGCKDTLRKKMEIIQPPPATITPANTCKGTPAQLTSTSTIPTGTVANTFTWIPSASLSCTNCPNPVTSVTATTIFTLQIESHPHGCVNSVTTAVYVQQPPLSINWDTTIVIGQQVIIPGYAGTGFNYTWTPITNLSCTNCPYPVSSTLEDITYTAFVMDTMGCFTGTNTFFIDVEPKSSVDVPTAFTPNGDGINDIIYVDGWGIKKLNFFRIYNRWGQLLFESNDMKVGWDGTYNGVPQNMETYVWQVSVESYIDSEPLFKTSTFKLIR
jgi:gliding motility-associated-like protein